MADKTEHAPTSAESAMAANAGSRDRQGKSADRAHRDPQATSVEIGAQEQSFGQVDTPSAQAPGDNYRPTFVGADKMLESERAFDLTAEQRAGDEGMAPSIKASRAHSAKLLREAVDLVVERTNAS
jgi:hypothetical protein